MAEIVSPQFTKIVEGILGAEGPVFDSDGNFFMVSPAKRTNDNQPAGEIFKVDLTNKKSELFCAPNINGDGGCPAGCQADKGGNLYVADMRLGILVVSRTGVVKQLARKDDRDQIMQGCNDCMFDYIGNLWCTGPAGEIAPSPFRKSFEEPFGSIYCYTAEGKMIFLDTGFKFCNGIAVKHDASGKPETLIVAETPTTLLWAYDIDGPGKISNKRVWAKLPATGCFGGPDGLDFDSAGNLLAAHHGSGFIDVVGPAGGDVVKRIRCPFSKPSNVHFKPGTKTVYVTEHDSHGLWKFEWEYTGMPQFCDV